jgi:CheY-like chemotaxis protein
VVGLLEPSAGRKGITLEVQRKDESICVEVDPKHLKQILFNLIQNSIKFTPSGGKVTIVSAIGPDSESVTVDVCDTGIGISKGEIDRIFDPVWHMGRQRFPEGAGSGLGLALTKTLVECEGGGILITSEEGKGTTVRVILNRGIPTSVTTHAHASELDMTGSRPLHGQSVLVVEPDDVLREALIRVIEKLGGAVNGVSLATEAVNAVHNNSYTAVFIDENVGEMSGYELAKLVRMQIPEDSSRIFVAASSGSAGEMRDGVSQSETIEKPLSPKAFLDALMAHDR